MASSSSSSRLRGVLEAGRAHTAATGVVRWIRGDEKDAGYQRDRDGAQEEEEQLDRERERERDRERDRRGECITVEVPEFYRGDAVQVVPPGRHPLTKELVLAFANSSAPIKEYHLELNNPNDPHFTIKRGSYHFTHSTRNVVPAGRVRPRPLSLAQAERDPNYGSGDLF